MQDEPSVNTEEAEIERMPAEIPQAPIETQILEDLDSVTQRNAAAEGPITPIDVIENIKLETFVNKTIVNDNNVVDVPDYQEKDKMLEEVRKMISEPPQDLTTVILSSPETTTYQHIPETTTEAPSTQPDEITTPSTIAINTTPAPEAETIFAPIITNNNENINVYDEKLSIVTTAESTTPVSDLVIDFINGHEARSLIKLSVDVPLIFPFMIYLSSIKVEFVIEWRVSQGRGRD